MKQYDIPDYRQIITPSGDLIPPSGFDSLYFKSDDNLYIIDSSGNERLVSDFNLNTGSFGITIDGAGSVPASGNYGSVVIPYSGNITSWYLNAQPSGSCTLDITRNSSSIIGAGNYPTLSSGITNHALVSGWTSTTISPYDTFQFLLDSADTLTQINLSIITDKA